MAPNKNKKSKKSTKKRGSAKGSAKSSSKRSSTSRNPTTRSNPARSARAQGPIIDDSKLDSSDASETNIEERTYVQTLIDQEEDFEFNPADEEDEEFEFNPNDDGDIEEPVNIERFPRSEYIKSIRKAPPMPIEDGQLTSVTPLPPNHPPILPKEFDWEVGQHYKAKTLCYDSGLWKDLLAKNEIAYGNFPFNNLSLEKQNEFIRELVKERVLFRYTADKMTICRPRRTKILQALGGNEQLDKKTIEISCKYIPKLKELMEAIHGKFEKDDVKLVMKVVRTTAEEQKSGGCSLHFDPYKPKVKKENQWKTRMIFTCGRWLKLFGFTGSTGVNDPLFMKLFKHGDFVILNRTSAGSDAATDGSRVWHSARLLPKPKDMENEAFVYTFVLDIYVKNKNLKGYWKNPQELLQWMVQNGFTNV